MIAEARAGALATRIVLAAAMLTLALGGCTDLSQRWELDRPRILAVGLADPALQPGESAAITLLVHDGTALAEVPPTIATTEQLPLDPAVAAAFSLAPDGGGWTVTAGTAEQIAAARAALALAEDEPLDVQFAVLARVGELDLVALKTVRLGADGANPPAPGILVAGSDATPAQLAREVETELEMTGLPPEPDDPTTATDEELLEVAWLVWSGEMTGSRTRTGTLTLPDDAPASGDIVAVVRNGLGGVSWTAIEAEVAE